MTRRQKILVGALAVLLVAVPAALMGERIYRGPANPDDVRVNRDWDETIRLQGNPNDPRGIKEPVLSRILGRDLYMPNTAQVTDDRRLKNLVSFDARDAVGATSPLGEEISEVTNPHKDLFAAADRLQKAAVLGRDLGAGDPDAIEAARAGVQESADDMLDILLGRTRGRLYDGFSLLNFNRWTNDLVSPEDFPDDILPDEYKMKQIRVTGDRVPSWKDDGTLVNVWEVTVRYFWYDEQFDSDTFLVKVPRVDPESGLTPAPDDVLRVRYVIYSDGVEEDFAPTQVMVDRQSSFDFNRGSVRFPYKGFDAVWLRIAPDTVSEVVVNHTALQFFRGIYTWGWNEHPPRIHFTQLVFEIENFHTGEIELDPEGMSYAVRNKELDIDTIGDAAPEIKFYKVALQALERVAEGTESTPEDFAAILAAMEDPDVEPRVDSWREWTNLMKDQRQIPPEVRAELESQGKGFRDYDFITVFLNNEMYGEGIQGHTIREWSQGEQMTVRLVNLDDHTHYFRNVGFGAALTSDIGQNFEDGIFSFETMNFKPLYGAPKVAEMQWRAGWGFRPHWAMIQQPDVFPRGSDTRGTQPLVAPIMTKTAVENPDGSFNVDDMFEDDGPVEEYFGYQFSAEHRHGDFPFNPPRFIIGNPADESSDSLYDLTGFPFRFFDGFFLKLAVANWDIWKELFPSTFKSGLVLGTRTEGWGIADMCPNDPHPGFCTQDIRRFNWRGAANLPAPADPNVEKTELRFPPFLRNPDRASSDAGDIIPPTGNWRPFLWVSPENGTIFKNGVDGSDGYWSDDTYSHGRTIFAGEAFTLTIEMPRASGQLFYQFDDLFHDNDIFSPHPIIDPVVK